jgi:Arc/MetJ-type ribon-helix-helix transcriptional regulator
MAQETLQKVTFSLPARMVEQLKTSAASAGYPSQNALVREALAREFKRLRMERLEREMEDAARDPEFIRDIEETMEAFKWVDAETARMIPE